MTWIGRDLMKYFDLFYNFIVLMDYLEKVIPF